MSAETTSTETSNEGIDLPGFFARRAGILQTLANESERIARQVTDLIPAGLERYRNEVFYATPPTTEWLRALKANTDNGSCNSDKIKDPDIYGFKDREDAKAKFLLLKEAWVGVIDVTIVDNPEDYLIVEFRLVQK